MDGLRSPKNPQLGLFRMCMHGQESYVFFSNKEYAGGMSTLMCDEMYSHFE